MCSVDVNRRWVSNSENVVITFFVCCSCKMAIFKVCLSSISSAELKTARLCHDHALKFLCSIVTHSEIDGLLSYLRHYWRLHGNRNIDNQAEFFCCFFFVVFFFVVFF